MPPKDAVEVEASAGEDETAYQVPYLDGGTTDYTIDIVNQSEADVTLVGFESDAAGLIIPVEYRMGLRDDHLVDFIEVRLAPNKFVRVSVRLLFTGCERYAPRGGSTLLGLNVRYQVNRSREQNEFLPFTKALFVESPPRDRCPRTFPPGQYSSDDAVWPA